MMPSHQPTNLAASGSRVRRLLALIVKESKQIRRDPSSIALALLMPVALLLLFGFGVSLDAENVPVGVVVDHPTADTASLIARFRGSRYFVVKRYATMKAAGSALARGRINAIVDLQSDFTRRLHAGGPAQIQVVVNGTDANQARQVQRYIQGAVATWQRQRIAITSQYVSAGAPTRGVGAQVPIESRLWFNEQARSENFLVPGLIVLIMILIGALLTALVMAREWERGTLEALLVTPVHATEILLGKLIPYFVLGMGGLFLAVAMGVFLFHVPLRGSLVVLTVCSMVFLLVALGMGLLISTLTRNQFVAGQMAIITTFLPAFFLSGFLFDLRSTPWFIRAVSRIVPARYFVSILQTLFLAGDVWAVVLPNLAALLLMAIIFLGLTRAKTHKRLE